MHKIKLNLGRSLGWTYVTSTEKEFEPRIWPTRTAAREWADRQFYNHAEYRIECVETEHDVVEMAIKPNDAFEDIMGSMRNVESV